jgi:hypothetical protein
MEGNLNLYDSEAKKQISEFFREDLAKIVGEFPEEKRQTLVESVYSRFLLHEDPLSEGMPWVVVYEEDGLEGAAAKILDMYHKPDYQHPLYDTTIQEGIGKAQQIVKKWHLTDNLEFAMKLLQQLMEEQSKKHKPRLYRDISRIYPQQAHDVFMHLELQFGEDAVGEARHKDGTNVNKISELVRSQDQKIADKNREQRIRDKTDGQNDPMADIFSGLQGVATNDEKSDFEKNMGVMTMNKNSRRILEMQTFLMRHNLDTERAIAYEVRGLKFDPKQIDEAYENHPRKQSDE